MASDLADVRRRSAPRNPELEINRFPEPFEAFVYYLSIAGRKPVEVHMPVEWVSIGSDGETIFSAGGRSS